MNTTSGRSHLKNTNSKASTTTFDSRNSLVRCADIEECIKWHFKRREKNVHAFWLGLSVAIGVYESQSKSLYQDARTSCPITYSISLSQYRCTFHRYLFLYLSSNWKILQNVSSIMGCDQCLFRYLSFAMWSWWSSLKFSHHFSVYRAQTFIQSIQSCINYVEWLINH